MADEQREEQLFVVRLWHEGSERRAADWRGYVEHVTSKQRMYFSDLADLNDFLHFRLGGGDRSTAPDGKRP